MTEINDLRIPNINKTRGQDLVEYALLVPIFLFLTLIIIDFGRVTFYYATLNNVGREGARWGVILAHHDNSDQLEAVARSHAFGLNPDDLTIQTTWHHPNTIPNNTPVSTHYVRVIASYTFSPILLPGQTFSLSSTTTMKLEY